MAKEKLPQLTEAQVRRLATDQSFERGKDYFRSGAILNPVRQGLELRADCSGSDYEPYQVTATLAKNGIAEASCDCPYEQGGMCKHLIALLLTYIHQPKAFRVVPPLTALLAERTKEELIALVGEMIKREPELLSVVELSGAAKQAQEGKPMDMAAYRRQTRRALGQENLRAMERELKALRDTAARLAKAGDWLNAGAIYHVLLDETVGQYDDILQDMDYDGDIAILADEFAQGLDKCLAKSQADSRTRRAWLETLLEAELTDIEIGGIDLAPSAREAVLKHATDEEWTWIEKRVRAEIATSRDWAREALVELLTERPAKSGRKADAAALIREMGTPEQQVFLLIREKKITEALRQIQQILPAKPGLATQFADALIEAKAQDAAVKLITERARTGDTRGTAWLAEYYRQHGSPQQALEWQKKIFLSYASVEAYKTLREVSSKLGNWEEVRAEALAALEREKKINCLIEIALHEKEVERALELLPRLNTWGWGNYKEPVAKAAEKDYPEAALKLYQELAERAIGQRQRDSYRQAAQYLKRVKALSERLKAKSAWDTYFQKLRSKHSNLPALRDELHKARL